MIKRAEIFKNRHFTVIDDRKVLRSTARRAKRTEKYTSFTRILTFLHPRRLKSINYEWRRNNSFSIFVLYLLRGGFFFSTTLNPSICAGIEKKNFYWRTSHTWHEVFMQTVLLCRGSRAIVITV